MDGFAPETLVENAFIIAPTQGEVIDQIVAYFDKGYHLVKITVPPWWKLFGRRYTAEMTKETAKPYLKLYIGPIVTSS